MSTQPDIRPSPFAGKFYPGRSQQLAQAVDKYMAQADTSVPAGRIIAVLAPHAGYQYSGAVAGHAFRPVQGMDVDIVVLVGPSHHSYPYRAITTGHDAYQTPLGQVPVAHDVLEGLNQTVAVQTVHADNEHSLEVELPFLQQVLGDFQIVPLSLIDQSLRMAQTLGKALAAELQDRKALLVASSDLSHYYPQAVANKLDQTMLDAVANFDPEAVLQAEEEGRGFACGRGAIATVMIAARALGANAADVVRYATSGDASGMYNQVVGYGAALFYQR
jgi:MEMO1 family protein